MSSIEQLKSEATALEAKARAEGHYLKHSEALEQVARTHGYDSWRACSAILGASPPVDTPQPKRAWINDFEMKRYKSKQWGFEVDIPARWNEFPVVPTNSPYEVNRFLSHEMGVHAFIIFRHPYDPEKGPMANFDQSRQALVKSGFGNFVEAETSIGSRSVLTLDFDKLRDNGDTWSCRHYYVVDGTLAYVLGFATTQRDAKFGLYDKMAKTFVVEEIPSPPVS